MNRLFRIGLPVFGLLMILLPVLAAGAAPAPPSRLLPTPMLNDREPSEGCANVRSTPQIGPGATIVVTTFDPNAASDSQCSLIEAMVNANDDAATHPDCPAGSGPDSIELSPGTYTLTAVFDPTSGGNGLPRVTSPITVNGHGAAIIRSADPQTPQFRIFLIDAGAALTLNDLAVSNGLVSGFSGGGLRNFGTLELNRSVVEHSTADAGGGIVNTDAAILLIHDSAVRFNLADGNVGGGIYNRGGEAVITDSVIQENTSSGYAAGGGILNWATGTTPITTTLAIGHSLVISNTANGDLSCGGGICNSANSGKSAILTMTDSTVASNRAQYGAGIGFTINDPPDPDSQGIIIGSTVSNNHAADASGGSADGGGIDVTSSTVTVVNSTISGNSVGAAGYSGGGGLWVGGFAGYPDGVAHLINSTVAGNTAAGEGGGIVGWEDSSANALVHSVNTIVSGNSAPAGANCVDGASGAGPVLVSSGYNMEDLDTCNFDQPTDHRNTDPLLGPLANNGGPTETRALLAGSPAIGVASNGVCAAPPVLGVDQRGVSRPQGAVCDIGAYELEQPPTAVTGVGLQAQAGVELPASVARALIWLLALLAGGLAAWRWHATRHGRARPPSPGP